MANLSAENPKDHSMKNPAGISSLKASEISTPY